MFPPRRSPDLREDGSVERELLPTPNDRATLASGGATIVQQGFSFTMDAFRSAGGFNAANRSTWDYELLARFEAAEVPFAVVAARFGAFLLYAAARKSVGWGRRG